MPFSLTLCSSCGYKICCCDHKSNTPQEVTAVKKRATREKCHFTASSYELCPQCKSSLATATTLNLDNDDDAEQEFIFLEHGSLLIRSFRKGAASYRDFAEKFNDVCEKLINQLEQAQNFDVSILTAQLDDIVAALQAFRESSTASIDRAIAAANTLKAQREEEE